MRPKAMSARAAITKNTSAAERRRNPYDFGGAANAFPRPERPTAAATSATAAIPSTFIREWADGAPAARFHSKQPAAATNATTGRISGRFARMLTFRRPVTVRIPYNPGRFAPITLPPKYSRKQPVLRTISREKPGCRIHLHPCRVRVLAGIQAGFRSKPRSGGHGRSLAGCEPQAQPLEQARIRVLARVWRGKQLIAEKHRIGAGQETQGLRFFGEGEPAGAQPNLSAWHEHPRRRDGAHQFERIFRRAVRQRRTRRAHQQVDGHAFGMGIERSQLPQQPIAGRAVFAHPDDAAATDRDSGGAHTPERIQALLVSARMNDLAVKFGRRIEVVVVSREARFGQRFGLWRGEHAERAAGFESQGAHAAHHLQHTLERLAGGHIAPRCPHAEARGALLAGAAGGG